MQIYTKEGDAGKSSLLGTKKRILKSKPVFELLGTADEINAILGCALSSLKKSRTVPVLEATQEDLFMIGAYIAGLKLKKDAAGEWEKKTHYLEDQIDIFQKQLPEIKSFIIPGGSEAASQIHLARVKVRSLERTFVSYINKGGKKSLRFLLPYINRLSDLLFVLARYVNMELSREERLWKPIK